MKHRKIIHLDLDAFFCAVEELKDPSLAGKAFAVGGAANGRGVISTCSYEARKYGIRSAMPTAKALKLFPDLLLLHGSYGEYSGHSKKVMKIVREYTPKVQQISVDEAFMDISDLARGGTEIANEIQRKIQAQVGLPCSFGIATNKLIAKIATDHGKSMQKGHDYPRSILEVPPGEERMFLAPMDVRSLWGIGPKTSERLHGMGIHTLGDLAALSTAQAEKLFGKYGMELVQRARGEDDSEVYEGGEAKSVSQETTFGKDQDNPELLRKVLLEQSAQVGRQLRKQRQMGSVVRIKIRWPDFSTYTRQMKVEVTSNDDDIFTAALKLLESVWDGTKKIRLIGVGVSGLQGETHQLNLFDRSDEKDRQMLTVLDELKAKFGEEIIHKGNVKSRRRF
ncbi:MAG TPA: DNA polymerase IV [Bellilinea sp.]|nr:DNA polymerase IV [Bellilinea sp.]